MVTIRQAALEMFTEKEDVIYEEKIKLTKGRYGGYNITIIKERFFVDMKKAEDYYKEQIKLRRAIEQL